MIWCELFAGSAAITYALHGVQPPISYQGSKWGYRKAIMQLLGLEGVRPSGVVLGEIGPMAAVHACLLGAKGVNAEEVARLVYCSMLSYLKDTECRTYSEIAGVGRERGPNGEGFEWTAVTPERYAGRIERTNSISSTSRAHEVAEVIRSWVGREPKALWKELKDKGWASLFSKEGRWLHSSEVAPEDVAALLWCTASSFCHTGNSYCGEYRLMTEHSMKFLGAKTCERYAKEYGSIDGRPLSPQGCSRPEVAAKVDAVGTNLVPPPFQAVWQGPIQGVQLPPSLEDWIIYLDPPYYGDGTRKITGYPYGTCLREDVLRLALEWSQRGALVAISECVPLPLDGWHHVDITSERRSMKRTFSTQQAEWITMNRPPRQKPQLSLFP